MSIDTQITESTMLSRFQVGEVLLAPLVIRSCVILGGPKDKIDARLEVGMPDRAEVFPFVVETKSRGTPQNIQLAMVQAKAAAQAGEWPMIQVPYLSPERILELEKAEVSGVDLCGNGVVVVPGLLWVVRVGSPNRFRDSRPLSNPYRGRSALVARMLLKQPHWQTLSELAASITSAGGELSLPQVSKAVQAMAEDLIVSKESGAIRLRDPLRLLDKLGSEWKTSIQFGHITDRAGGRSTKVQMSPYHSRQSLRLPKGTDWAQALSSAPELRWTVSGESSVNRYAMFAQGGPQRIVVSDIVLALARLGGIPEPVPNFADIELLQTEDSGAFFDQETDANGVRWAGKLQTWLELQAGDARQQEAAKEIREQILKEVQK
jgi:hypothetical protein